MKVRSTAGVLGLESWVLLVLCFRRGLSWYNRLDQGLGQGDQVHDIGTTKNRIREARWMGQKACLGLGYVVKDVNVNISMK